jgi:hypothetical protein
VFTKFDKCIISARLYHTAIRNENSVGGNEKVPPYEGVFSTVLTLKQFEGKVDSPVLLKNQGGSGSGSDANQRARQETTKPPTIACIYDTALSSRMGNKFKTTAYYEVGDLAKLVV